MRSVLKNISVPLELQILTRTSVLQVTSLHPAELGGCNPKKPNATASFKFGTGFFSVFLGCNPPPPELHSFSLCVPQTQRYTFLLFLSFFFFNLEELCILSPNFNRSQSRFIDSVRCLTKYVI